MCFDYTKCNKNEHNFFMISKTCFPQNTVPISFINCLQDDIEKFISYCLQDDTEEFRNAFTCNRHLNKNRFLNIFNKIHAQGTKKN